MVWNFLENKWHVLIWDFDKDVGDLVDEFNWLAKTFATSDAAVKSDGGNCGFDNEDDDSSELSVYRRLFDDVCSELVWDWTSGENIGFNNIPRLCWTVDAEGEEKKSIRIFSSKIFHSYD